MEEGGMEAVKIQIHPDQLKELVVGKVRFRSALDFRLSDDDLEICRKELKETESVRNASLRKLREKLADEKELTYRTDETFLLRYLRYKKFDCVETYKQLRRFYKMRAENPDLFLLPHDINKMLNKIVFYMLPYTTEEGTILFLIKAGKWNVHETSVSDTLLMFNLMSDIATINPRSQVNGVVDMFDLANVSISTAAHVLLPSNARLWAKVLQDLYPWRIRRLVFFNCPALLYGALAGLRFFLKKKVADRVIILRSDVSELHKYVNPSLLPKECGGNLEDSEWKSYLHRHMLNNVQYTEYENSFIRAKTS